MWDWLTRLQDKYIGTQIVIEAPRSFGGDEWPMVIFYGKVCDNTWGVWHGKPVGDSSSSSVFPSFGQVRTSSSLAKSEVLLTCNTEFVRDFIARVEKSTTPLSLDSQIQIAYFKDTADICSCGKLSKARNFGLPKVPLKVASKTKAIFTNS